MRKSNAFQIKEVRMLGMRRIATCASAELHRWQGERAGPGKQHISRRMTVAAAAACSCCSHGVRRTPQRQQPACPTVTFFTRAPGCCQPGHQAGQSAAAAGGWAASAAAAHLRFWILLVSERFWGGEGRRFLARRHAQLRRARGACAKGQATAEHADKQCGQLV